MIPIRIFAEEHVAIFGLGRSGMAAARALRRGGAQVLICDDDEARMEAAAEEGFTACTLDELPWPELSALVLSPGVPLTHPAPHPVVLAAKSHDVEIVGDIELLVRELNTNYDGVKVVAITGTNGKSTTTSLAGHVLRHANCDVRIGGNIGEAVLGLPEPTDDTIYVLEVSSYQVDLTPSLSANVAVLLNITPDHLERHGGMDGYVDAKRRIFSGQGGQERPSSVLTTGIHQNLYADHRKWCRYDHPHICGKTLGRGVYAIDGILFDGTNSPSTEIVDFSECRAMKGRHNWQNAAAAFSIAKALGVATDTIAEGLRTFPGLPHRLENVGKIGGVEFVNDSKATNVDATARALECFDQVLWIAGGQPKGANLDELQDYFPRIKKAYLIGEASDQFSTTLAGKVDFEKAVTLSTALDHVMCDLALCEGDEPVVLFSPACASFDQSRILKHAATRFDVWFSNCKIRSRKTVPQHDELCTQPTGVRWGDGGGPSMAGF